MSKTRSLGLPAVPTIAEAGFVTLTDMKDRLATLGFEPVVNTPEEFADRIKEDFEAWGKLIRAANLKAG
jgi:tripartite-type tricarboxylate transporter receptor subunit TctC